MDELKKVGNFIAQNPLLLTVNFSGFAKPFNVRRIGRGGGDRKDKLLNKAWALYALQPLPLSNRNKRNRRQAEPALGTHYPTPTAPPISSNY
jgi:hypothetical protein